MKTYILLITTIIEFPGMLDIIATYKCMYDHLVPNNSHRTEKVRLTTRGCMHGQLAKDKSAEESKVVIVATDGVEYK